MPYPPFVCFRFPAPGSLFPPLRPLFCCSAPHTRYDVSMPRMARIVIPGVPHHVTRARQPPRGRLLRRRGQAAVLDVGGRCGGSLCAATPCSNRTPAGRRSVRSAPGENPRPHLPPPQTRPASQPKTEEEMILCPRNSPELLRRHSRTGRPWADPRVLARLEKPLSRRLTPGRAGRPRKGP